MHPSESADLDPELIEEYLERCRRGENPSLDEFAARLPERSEEIRELLTTALMMEKAKAGLDQTTPAAGVILNGKPVSQFGDFRLLREVGRGAMGIVYEAEQLSLRRRVALKIMLTIARANDRQLERFLQESRAAARLHHTNIVPVFGLGEQDGLHYYYMQFIPGLGLDEVLKALKRVVRADGSLDETALLGGSTEVISNLLGNDLSLSHQGTEAYIPEAPPSIDQATWSWSDTVLEGMADKIKADSSFPGTGLQKLDSRYFRSVAHIGVQVADALAYAHSHRILHRDIKPSNLILDGNGTIWVTDFGLAKVSQEHTLTQTAEGDVVGTILYMAPERFRGASDPRCDVCSLGLTLYEMLALRPAFSGFTRAEIMCQIHEGHIQPVRKIRPEVPHDLETIVMKAVDPVPESRYQSAYELAEDLRNFLGDRVIKARRTAAVERLRRWCRRNPLVAGLVFTVAFLMAAITLGSVYGMRRLALEQEARTQELADKLLTAPAMNFPYIFDALRSRRDGGWRDLAAAKMAQVFADPVTAPNLKSRAAVVLTLLGRPQLDSLIQSARAIPASEGGNFILALRAAGGDAVARLRELAAVESDLPTKAKLASMLLGLEDGSIAREMLAAREDPLPRTIFIHDFAANGALFEVPALLSWHVEASFQSGLCLAIGGMDPTLLPADLRSRLESSFRDLYLNAPSGATHSAAGWALRAWKAPLPAIEPDGRPTAGRGWFTNSLGMAMLEVPSGFATLGGSGELYAPRQAVYISKAFFLSDREVPVRLFEAFLADPGYPAALKPRDWPGPDQEVSPGPDFPVQNISLFDAILFANWLSWKEGRQPAYISMGEGGWHCDFQANGYRLPTEGEWEHACRAGSKTAFFLGDASEWLGAYTHTGRSSSRGGEHLPNPLGLFDMLGNVSERCWDIYPDPYPDSTSSLPRLFAIDPIGPADRVDPGSKTIIRGGSMRSGVADYMSGRRLDLSARRRSPETGFRIACGGEKASAQKVIAALRANDTSPEETWRALARAYSVQGRMEEGAADLARLLEERPGDAHLRIQQGRLLTALFRWEEAAVAYREAARELGDRGPSLFEGSWWLAGPYPEDLMTSCPPEKDCDPDPRGREKPLWRPIVPSDGDLIRFDAFLENREHISGYALTCVHSLRDQDVTLLTGSDDQVRVWVNGELVHQCTWLRLASPEDDQIPVRLRAGWNKVLAKVTNFTGGHFLYLRLSTEPVRLVRTLGKLGRWAQAEAALREERGTPGHDSPQLMVEHARALASLGRAEEAVEVFRQSAEAAADLAAEWLQSSWWVLPPCPKDLAPEQLLDPAPDPSRPVTAGGSVLAWQATLGEGEEEVVDLSKTFDAGRFTTYALTHVWSPGPQDAALLVRSNPSIRVWINGDPALEYPRLKLPATVTERSPVKLRAGWNWILARLEDDSKDEKFSLRLSRARMNPHRPWDAELSRELSEAIKDANARIDDPSVQLRLGNVFAEMEEWRSASWQFAEALKHGASERVRRLLLMTYLARGSSLEARETGRRCLLSLSTSETRASDLGLALWSSVVSPELTASMGRLMPLAELAVKRDPEDPLCLSVMGALRYRSGEYKGAMDSLHRAIDRGKEGTAAAYARFLLAMAQRKLEGVEPSAEARERLEQAIQASEACLRQEDGGPVPPKRRLAWDEGLSLRLLRREAEALFRPATARPRTSPQRTD